MRENPAKSILDDAWECGEGSVHKKCSIFKIKKEMGELECSEWRLPLIVHRQVVPTWLLPTPEIEFSVLESLKNKGSTSYSELVASRLKQLLATPSSNVRR